MLCFVPRLGRHEADCTFTQATPSSPRSRRKQQDSMDQHPGMAQGMARSLLRAASDGELRLHVACIDGALAACRMAGSTECFALTLAGGVAWTQQAITSLTRRMPLDGRPEVTRRSSTLPSTVCLQHYDMHAELQNRRPERVLAGSVTAFLMVAQVLRKLRFSLQTKQLIRDEVEAQGVLSHSVDSCHRRW